MTCVVSNGRCIGLAGDLDVPMCDQLSPHRPAGKRLGSPPRVWNSALPRPAVVFQVDTTPKIDDPLRFRWPTLHILGSATGTLKIFNSIDRSISIDRTRVFKKS